MSNLLRETIATQSTELLKQTRNQIKDSTEAKEIAICTLIESELEKRGELTWNEETWTYEEN